MGRFQVVMVIMMMAPVTKWWFRVIKDARGYEG